MKATPQRWRDEGEAWEPQAVQTGEQLAGFLLARVSAPPLRPLPMLQVKAVGGFWHRWRYRLVTLGTLVGFNLALAAFYIVREQRGQVPAVQMSTKLENPILHPTSAQPVVSLPRPTVVPLRTRSSFAGPRLIRRAAPIPSLASPPLPSVSVLPPSPPTLSLSEETQEIGTALRQLRQEHDPAGALASLVIYRHRFPRGALAAEADALQLDADLALGRRQEALALLGETLADPQPPPRALTLRVLRAELLAQEGRCPEALRDFEPAIGRSAPPDLRERALFGRALCRARNGDPNGGREDLETYLREFPSGRFKAPARGALGNLPEK